MQGLRWVQLTEQELNDFLGDGGTGTLSFSTEIEEPPFSLPVSYGYDGDGHFYFRLSLPDESGKADRLGNEVTFVTHAQTDRGWRSVVATGTLEDVSDMDYDSAAVQGMWAVDIPQVDVFDRPREEIEFRQFRLDPEKLTGRKEVESDS